MDLSDPLVARSTWCSGSLPEHSANVHVQLTFAPLSLQNTLQGSCTIAEAVTPTRELQDDVSLHQTLKGASEQQKTGAYDETGVHMAITEPSSQTGTLEVGFFEQQPVICDQDMQPHLSDCSASQCLLSGAHCASPVPQNHTISCNEAQCIMKQSQEAVGSQKSMADPVCSMNSAKEKQEPDPGDTEPLYRSERDEEVQRLREHLQNKDEQLDIALGQLWAALDEVEALKHVTGKLALIRAFVCSEIMSKNFCFTLYVRDS
jgi:hypothetical protein